MNGNLELLAFAGVMALAQFSPGPDMILLTRTSLAEGARAGAVMACGIASGLAVHTGLAVSGLVLAFDRMPMLHRAMAWGAAGYLLWLAYRLMIGHFIAWYSHPRPAGDVPVEEVPVQEEPVKIRQPYRRGLICNLLNPKAILILASICTDFMKGPRPGWWPLALWSIVVFQGALLWALWAWLLQWPPLKDRYQRASKWIDLAFGVALAALAVRLVV